MAAMAAGISWLLVQPAAADRFCAGSEAVPAPVAGVGHVIDPAKMGLGKSAPRLSGLGGPLTGVAGGSLNPLAAASTLDARRLAKVCGDVNANDLTKLRRVGHTWGTAHLARDAGTASAVVDGHSVPSQLRSLAPILPALPVN
ncbi:hypothetical protein D5H75_30140 [Bailinhaonella thermotolerans]|uniref:Uncharacterized protein n=1 Tax=Bailinhaonella thermotolerans TaxID=1070861 RepID=A0A3A4ABB9_9ACTN|nr:hypothetical protein D5H75_30140 [Bailinhaonella thermotolerans]